MQKWFHAIGVCGKATSLVAAMFADMGWFVTGSDLQFFPPASDFLKEKGILTTEGYHYSHLTKSYWADFLKKDLNIPSQPDLCMVVESVTAKNKEYLYAKTRGIIVKPYSQILNQYLVKPESIVIAGTAGKTTTTALLIHLMEVFRFKPSYMVGADLPDKESIKNTISSWSVIEGDEYYSKELSAGPKFWEYNPKYLIISNIGWEHQDVYPTHKEYLEAFSKLVKMVPKNGLIIAKADDANIDQVLRYANTKVVRYNFVNKGGNTFESAQYAIQESIDASKETGTGFEILSQKGNLLKGTVKMIGKYNLENVLAAYCFFKEIIFPLGKFKDTDFISVVKTFAPPRKRLEILADVQKESRRITIVDDFGVTAPRVAKSLEIIKEEYKDSKIIAIFEPNAGSRPRDEAFFKTIYQDVFNNANQVLIPDLSSFNEDLIDSPTMAKRLQEMGIDALAMPLDALKVHLKSILNPNHSVLLAFFSSYRLTSLAHEIASLVKL